MDVVCFLEKSMTIQSVCNIGYWTNVHRPIRHFASIQRKNISLLLVAEAL